MISKILCRATLSLLPISVFLAITPAAFTQSNAQSSVSYSWVAASNGQVPRGAFAAGSEKGRPLYLCHARYNNGIHPGKVVDKDCHISWGGKEVLIRSYEVLTAPRPVRLKWVAASNGQVPQGAFRGGYEKNRPLYVCRAAHNEGLHPGKVVDKNCDISYRGRAVVIPNYEVLVGQEPSR